MFFKLKNFLSELRSRFWGLYFLSIPFITLPAALLGVYLDKIFGDLLGW